MNQQEHDAKPCMECGGRGWVDNRCITPDHSHRCALCNGIGQMHSGAKCTGCQGTGLIEIRKEDKNPCPLCNGAGIFPVPDTMMTSEFAYKPKGRHR